MGLMLLRVRNCRFIIIIIITIIIIIIIPSTWLYVFEHFLKFYAIRVLFTLQDAPEQITNNDSLSKFLQYLKWNFKAILLCN